MSSQWNDFTYASQFNGNLHKETEPVPVRVTTRLRIMTRETADQVQQYAHHLSGKPRYLASGGKQATYEAVGRHFFTWKF